MLRSAARASQATRQCSTSQYFHNEKAKRKCEHLYLAKQYLLLLMSGDNKRCPGKVINPASSSLKKRQMEVKALRNNGTEVNNHRQSHHPGSLEPELMICLCSRALVRHLAALFGSNNRDRKMPRHPNQEQCLIFMHCYETYQLRFRTTNINCSGKTGNPCHLCIATKPTNLCWSRESR